MESDTRHPKAMTCKDEVRDYSGYRQKLPGVVEDILAGCGEEQSYTHIDYEPAPSEAEVIDILQNLREMLFPGFFSREKIDPVNLKYNMGRQVTLLYDMLAEQITRAVRYECFKFDLECSDCRKRGYEAALAFLQSVPDLQHQLAKDVVAAYKGDPAAKSYDEIIFSYPGMFAIMVYRIAHRLHALSVPLVPRIMTEHSHRITGIDIHPGAVIGESFTIDHGTGVVVGETARIGDNVRIYQGVTIGALSVPRSKADEMRETKRHPTIENDVVIYSGATILGGDTIIGARSVIGGNVWITEPVPADTTVLLESPRLIYRKNPLRV
ncbi:serine O-acetyltransferase [Desulfosalsimonas propionicica]|uniref:Serine O-acetyltransferase n=1 Tax=Desulfosalsimonas propionicica TaxID=332175 RepID=A0A7W0CA80_9BACT|nr:serine O-acetyltransferase EpsC [Desulfosalsimonas propionicica]MBA2882026.1 serine O-acetyltransferase [Desulfosalsimonas propionicica]